MTTYEEIFLEKFGRVLAYEGNGELVFSCPECGKKLRGNVDLGVVHCFNCGFGKGLKFDGAKAKPIEKKKFNIDLQIQLAKRIIEETKLSPYHKQYLENRGIVDPESYGIRTIPFDIGTMVREVCGDRAPDSGLAYTSGALGAVIDPRRIFIPYWYGEELVGFKTRTNPYEEGNDKRPRYYNPPGTRVPQFPMWMKKSPHSDVVITEGELKNIVVAEGGYETYSISGIGVTGSCISKINFELRGNPNRRFVVLDREPNGPDHLGVLRATSMLSKRLRACPVILPGKKGEKTGVDDFILAHGYEEFEEVLNVAWMRSEATQNWLTKRLKELNNG